MRSLSILLVICLAIFVLAPAANATVYTFNGSTWTSLGDWLWQPGGSVTVLPGINDIANFTFDWGDYRTINLNGNESIGTMNLIHSGSNGLDGFNYTFDTGGGDTLTLGSGGLTVSIADTQVFNCAIAGTGTSITLNPGAATTEANNGSLGIATLNLANTANSFSGAINVYGGILQVNGDTALGSTSNTITMGSVGAIGELYEYYGQSLTSTAQHHAGRPGRRTGRRQQQRPLHV